VPKRSGSPFKTENPEKGPTGHDDKRIPLCIAPAQSSPYDPSAIAKRMAEDPGHDPSQPSAPAYRPGIIKQNKNEPGYVPGSQAGNQRKINDPGVLPHGSKPIHDPNQIRG
jgi:hypothetical protein